jgi:hypothetical protein
MSVDLWSWRTFVSSAVGAAVVLVPIYLFGFKQLIDSKDAAIETLREQIKSLERECVAAVIQEKYVLIQDIEGRAKEKAETDKIIEYQTKQIGDQIKKVDDIRAKIVSTTGGVQERIRREESIGLIMGVKTIQEGYVEWRLLYEALPPSAAVIAFDLFFRARFDKINELLNRISSGGELVTLEELKIDPNVTRKIAQIAEAAKRSSVTDAGSNREPVH